MRDCISKCRDKNQNAWIAGGGRLHNFSSVNRSTNDLYRNPFEVNQRRGFCASTVIARDKSWGVGIQLCFVSVPLQATRLHEQITGKNVNMRESYYFVGVRCAEVAANHTTATQEFSPGPLTHETRFWRIDKVRRWSGSILGRNGGIIFRLCRERSNQNKK